MGWLVWMLVAAAAMASGYLLATGLTSNVGVAVILATAVGIALACVTAGLLWLCLAWASGRLWGSESERKDSSVQTKPDDDPWGPKPR
jgi:hypothetical protein